MRNIKHMLCGLSLTGAAVAGCSGAGAVDPAGQSEARITVSSQAIGAIHVNVTATDDTTSQVTVDKDVEVQAGGSATLDLMLAPSSYTIHAQTFADAAEIQAIGEGSAQADLAAGAVTNINLVTGGNGSSGGGLSIDVHAAPQIHDVDVQVDSGGLLGGLVGSNVGAQFHVDASAADGGDLAFYWSGLGLEGAVQGSSTLSLSAAAVAADAGPPAVHVVVEDSAGATAEADIQFTPANGCILCGVFQSSIGAAADASASAEACLDGQGHCVIACDASAAAGSSGASAHASCLGACGLALASCLAE